MAGGTTLLLVFVHQSDVVCMCGAVCMFDFVDISLSARVKYPTVILGILKLWNYRNMSDREGETRKWWWANETNKIKTKNRESNKNWNWGKLAKKHKLSVSLLLELLMCGRRSVILKFGCFATWQKSQFFCFDFV